MKQVPFTPRMVAGLKALQAGDTLDFATTCVGRPTKQRLAKFGLAEYLTPKDWDGPMRITAKGVRAIMHRGSL